MICKGLGRAIMDPTEYELRPYWFDREVSLKTPNQQSFEFVLDTMVYFRKRIASNHRCWADDPHDPEWPEAQIPEVGHFRYPQVWLEAPILAWEDPLGELDR